MSRGAIWPTRHISSKNVGNFLCFFLQLTLLLSIIFFLFTFLWARTTDREKLFFIFCCHRFDESQEINYLNASLSLQYLIIYNSLYLYFKCTRSVYICNRKTCLDVYFTLSYRVMYISVSNGAICPQFWGSDKPCSEIIKIIDKCYFYSDKMVRHCAKF
jgi:hypothetical protein